MVAHTDLVPGYNPVYFPVHHIGNGGGRKGAVVYKEGHDGLGYADQAASNQFGRRDRVLWSDSKTRAVEGEESIEVVVRPVNLGSVFLESYLPSKVLDTALEGIMVFVGYPFGASFHITCRVLSSGHLIQMRYA